ncbi:MAG: hypothetical protein AAGE94_10355 [Acidobacteriota bacterium]
MPSFSFRADSFCRCLVVALALGLIAGPAWSYVVILKDGEQISVDGEPERRGDNMILTLPNGNQVSYPVSDIDLAKTEELNAGSRLSNARILETGNAQTNRNEPPPERRPTLADLVGNRPGGSIALPDQAERSGAAAGPQHPTTGAGFIDFAAMKRLPYAQDDIAADLMLYLRGQGHEEVRIYQGTDSVRPLVEITAASEASVFKALRDSANGLLQVGQRHTSLDVIELLLVTEAQVRAGQFTLTEPLASQLATGQIQPPTFFLRYVEF